MKNNIRISLLVSALALLVQAPICADIHDRIEYKLNRVLRDVEIINNEIASECTTIVPKDFEDENGVLSQTYVIAAPGKYCLGANIDFEPLDEYTPAIVILSDAVSLNLNGFTLRQAEFNGTANAYGVQIGQGYFYDDPDAVLKNITIFNGNITNFSAIGVFCYNGSFDGGAGELAFQDLHFFDLNILDCGSSPSFDFGSGINLDSFAPIPDWLVTPTTPVAYSGVIIENCNVNRCLGNAAIQIYIVDNLVVKNTQANDLTTEIDVIGVFAHVYNGRNIQIVGCQGNGVADNDSTPPSPSYSSQCGGLGLNLSLNVQVENSQFNDAFGENVYIVNSNLSLNHNDVYENCQFNNARGGVGAIVIAGVHRSSGVGQTSNGKGSRFINCQFNGASISPDNPGGFSSSLIAGFVSIATNNDIFENCQFCNINVDENIGFRAIGMFIGTEPYRDDPRIPGIGAAYCQTFKDCIFSDIKGGKVAAGFVSGVVNYNLTGIQGVQTNIVIDNCIAERISCIAPEPFLAAGITETLLFIGNNPIRPFAIYTFFDKMRNLQIKNCRVSDVRSNVEIPNSAGILITSVQNPVLLNNSVSDCDRGILLTGTSDLIPNAFQLAASLDDALAFPPVFVDLKTVPSASPLQTFFNTTQGNSVTIAPSLKIDTLDSNTIDTKNDFIWPTGYDLTALGWQPGDAIFYDCNGGAPISDLVCTTTYYAIVYVPGFSENGVIEQNEVDNCSVSGYQDDAPVTSSAWVDNLAFNDGTPASAAANYAITWAGVPPVDAGTLAAYPVGGNKYYNLSLIP